MYFDTLPSDPIMLLSFVNTRLRDEYGSLKELCSALNVDACAPVWGRSAMYTIPS